MQRENKANKKQRKANKNLRHDETKSAKIKNSDKRLSAEIKTHLGNHDEIDTSGVKVAVQNGDVELSGAVDNAHAKSLACNITTQEVKRTKKVSSKNLKFRRDNCEAP